jgi:hypothetical protein
VALAPAPAAAADPPLSPGVDRPLAQGNYTRPGDDGWIFFIVEFGGKPSDYHDQFGCGSGPDGTIGCDRVPHPVQIGLEPPIWVSPGANQTVGVANRSEPGSYRFSDTPTFTRDVDILPEGHGLVNGDARCAMGYRGS